MLRLLPLCILLSCIFTCKLIEWENFLQEIKRWKDAEVDDYSHIQSAMPSGGDWNIIAIASNGSTVCTGVNGAISGGPGTGHATSSCCSATGTNVSTPTTTGNGPWPDGKNVVA